jgi:hypothetical protein
MMFYISAIVVFLSVWLNEVMGPAGVVFAAPAIGAIVSMLILGDRK